MGVVLVLRVHVYEVPTDCRLTFHAIKPAGLTTCQEGRVDRR
jgi:hypothetical protein